MTISDRIAEWCANDDFANSNAQLCVVSTGLNAEGIASHVIRRALCSRPSPNACVSCVLLPDGTGSHTLTRVAAAISASFRNETERLVQKGEEDAFMDVRVHVADESAAPRDRCAFYQTGGVVVIGCRMLCADLLHRRVSRALIGVAVVLLALPDGGRGSALASLVPGMAFCAEMLLRGGTCGASALTAMGVSEGSSTGTHPIAINAMPSAVTGGVEANGNEEPIQQVALRRRPPFVVLCDDPSLARYLVQRRRPGQETFLSQMHIDDIQLYPRFRLSLVRHFERVAKERPLMVERVAVGVMPTLGALDTRLCDVLREVVGELHQLEERLGSTPSAIKEKNSSHHTCDNGAPSSVRFRLDRAHHLSKSRPAPRYVRRPWQTPWDESGIQLRGIADTDALDASDRGLDDDLHAALRGHDNAWPFARLVESLLDLRRLRRTLPVTTAGEFLLTFEAVLARRTSRRPNAAPDAPWTLSRHFGQIVTLAVHRVGEVQSTAPVVVDVEQDGDNGTNHAGSHDGMHALVHEAEAGGVGYGVGSGFVGSHRFLRPRREEVDPCMECATRVTQSWCRDTLRRQSKSKDNNHSGPPSMLLIVLGTRALRRYVCRLTHTLEDFQTLELNAFVAAYQSRYGADLRRQVTTSTEEEEETPKGRAMVRRTWFVCPNDSDSEDSVHVESDSGEVGGHFSQIRERPVPSQAVSALHDVILSQPPLPTTDTGANAISMNECPSNASTAKGTTAGTGLTTATAPLPLCLESVGDGFVRLCAAPLPSHGMHASPRVMLVDGALLRVVELIALLDGTHAALATLARPNRVLLTAGTLRLLRLIESAQDALRVPLPRVQLLSIRALSPQSDLSDAAVVAEREAFEGLAHAKAGLATELLADRDAIYATRAEVESGVAHTTRRARPPLLPAHSLQRPLVVFDEREFRSLLPYALYRRGVDLVPLTLATGDYVLSPTHALERKSVSDFVQSLLSGRLHTQLSALSRRYEHPMCLIEFDRSAPFRLATTANVPSTNHSASHPSTLSLFARSARLFASFPRVHVIWSRDASHSAAMMEHMKRTCAKEAIDPSAPLLTRSAAAAEAEDAAAAKETAHLAARVLSCFPGITPGNAQAVMALCGSLAGLATIEETALAAAMGEEAARKLYAFLHEDVIHSIG